MAVHHGKTIERIIRREGHSLTAIAKSARVNRRSVYNWFLKSRLKPSIIQRLGLVIEHDFSVEFPELFTTEDFSSAAKKSLDLNDEADMQIDVWKEKYIDLLERYNFLLSRN